MSEAHPFGLDMEERTASPDSSSFGEILSQFEESHRHDSESGRSARTGTVVSVTETSVFLDIGLKTEGVIAAGEFRNAKGEMEVKAGDTVTVSISGRDAEGYYQLSKLRVERPKDWSSLEKAFDERGVIAGVVTESVKGGLSVDVGVRAFMPASRSGAKDPAEIEQLIGQEIRCKIIELNVAKEDVVVDRRAVLEEEEAKAKQKAFDDLKEGAVVQGTVRTLTQFGAFVDIGGVDGLLHVSDMSWGRVNKPADVVSTGDSIEVQILKIDRASKRVSLSLKQLQPDPWSTAAEAYQAGQRVRGKVVRVMDFGAFVELQPGLEGLIHLSEMSWSRKTPKPKDIVKPGEAVEVVVLGVNAPEKRIALGLKQALGDPWEELEKKFPAGSTVEGPVVSLTNFGAFVDMGEGIEGMIHVGDITREKRLNHPKEALNTGQRVRAMVLEIDKAKRRIRLGMKQLEPTSADEYIAEHQSGDVVTGRLVEVRGAKAKVELGDGVFAVCRMPAEPEKKEAAPEDAAKPDLNALTAMLSAKWKQGKTSSLAGRREPAQAGQIRSFRILAMDAGAKTIDLELAG